MRENIRKEVILSKLWAFCLVYNTVKVQDNFKTAKAMKNNLKYYYSITITWVRFSFCVESAYLNSYSWCNSSFSIPSSLLVTCTVVLQKDILGLRVNSTDILLGLSLSYLNSYFAFQNADELMLLQSD